MVDSVRLMREQLQYLYDICERPGFTLQITPFPAGSATAPGSFSILHFAAADLPDVVYLEQLTSAMYLDKRSDVDRYTEALDKISAKSATPAESRKIISVWLKEMEGSL